MAEQRQQVAELSTPLLKPDRKQKELPETAVVL